MSIFCVFYQNWKSLSPWIIHATHTHLAEQAPHWALEVFSVFLHFPAVQWFLGMTNFSTIGPHSALSPWHGLQLCMHSLDLWGLHSHCCLLNLLSTSGFSCFMWHNLNTKVCQNWVLGELAKSTHNSPIHCYYPSSSHSYGGTRLLHKSITWSL